MYDALIGILLGTQQGREILSQLIELNAIQDRKFAKRIDGWGNYQRNLTRRHGKRPKNNPPIPGLWLHDYSAKEG